MTLRNNYQNKTKDTNVTVRQTIYKVFWSKSTRGKHATITCACESMSKETIQWMIPSGLNNNSIIL